MSNRSKIATGKFLEGFNCAQSVLFSFCDVLSIDKNTALRVASGFGAGMGKKQEVCGAVTGAIMTIGLKYGRDEQGESSRAAETYGKTREFMDLFVQKHGSCNCRKLLGECDLMTELGQDQFQKLELKKNVCTPCVESAVEIAEKLL